jgi:hypothetical protein
MNTNYLNERIYKGLGITPEQCNVKLYTDSGLRPVPIFDQDREGNIRIIMYDIRRQIITLENAPERNIDRFCDNVTEKTAYLTRLRPEYLAEHPDAPKYRMNPGERTRPFFPPALIEKYEQKTHIPTLFLTEGYIKAFAANVLAGFDIVGLQSVTCYTDKLGKIHKDILDLIEVCGVRNVVMIYDGDALDISDKDLAREEELTRRPYMFINSALSIKNLLSGLNVDFWFMHQHRETPNAPKGLDDLILDTQQDKRPEILDDAQKLGSVGKSGNGSFFYRLNLTTNANRLKTHFCVNSPDAFYTKWAEKIGNKIFTFQGSKYRLDVNGELILEMPGELKQYYRIGTGYYRLLPYTDVWTGEHREKLVPWQKGCIMDDFKEKVKNPTDKIKKLDGFTFFPDNERYTRIKENKWNLYNEIKFDPAPGYFDNIKTLLRHIFGEQFEMGLDYIQLMYQRPKQQLPILCLVSKERQTGKTTFCNFLSDLFGENAIIVGNNAFTGQFNGFMAGKLIVCCDETKLAERNDTVEITEKIKRMATERYTMIEFKGQDAQQLPNFAKFILCSNNERNFIYTDKEEVRFWVRKVGHIDNLNTHLIEAMHEEIPAFLYFLNNRKLSTEETTRAWFAFDLLKTEALKELQEQQQPLVIREINDWLEDMFAITGKNVLCYSLADLQDNITYLKNSKTAQTKIRSLISEHLGINPKRGRYSYFFKSTGFDGDHVLQQSKTGSFFEFTNK